MTKGGNGHHRVGKRVSLAYIHIAKTWWRKTFAEKNEQVGRLLDPLVFADTNAVL